MQKQGSEQWDIAAVKKNRDGKGKKNTPPSGCVLARYRILVPLMGLREIKNAAYPERSDRENNVLCGTAVLLFSLLSARDEITARIRGRHRVGTRANRSGDIPTVV